MPYTRWTPEPDVALLERQLFPDHQQLLAFATQVQLPQSPQKLQPAPLPKEIVQGLLAVRTVDDVLPTLEAIATAGDMQVLRDLYMVASKIQEGIRQVCIWPGSLCNIHSLGCLLGHAEARHCCASAGACYILNRHSQPLT